MSELLPRGWVQSTIKVLAGTTGLFADGDWIESKDQDPNGNIRLLQLADIGDGAFLDKSNRWINGEAFERLRCTALIAGDVLVARMPDPLGRACLMPALEQRCVTVVDVAALRVDPKIADNRWAMHTVNSPQIRAEISAQSSGTTRKRISRGKLGEMEIPLPPKTEQTRIADQLDKLLARIQSCNDRLDAIPALLKRFRQAVISAAVTGKLSRDWRDAKENILFPWQEVRVSDAGRVQLGRQRAPKYHSGNHMRPYLRVQNVFEARLDLRDVMEMDFPPDDFERYQLHPGDILLNEGQSPEYLGRPAIYRGELPGACFTNTLIRFQPYSIVLSEFALIVFRHHMHIGRYVREGNITTNIAHLGASRFASVEFPLPTLEEQSEIVSRVEALFKLADRIEARYSAARAQAQRLSPLLLAKAFRGELVQQDPLDEPATVLLERIAAASPTKIRTARGRQRIRSERQLPLPEINPPQCESLQEGAWAAPTDPDGHATMAGVVAVLRAWSNPVPEREARLAVLFCLQPRLLTAVLPTAEAKQWSRLIGDEARPLPAQVLSFQPAINAHWGRAIKGMRARGDLVEVGAGKDIAWALGADAASVETAGWPDGRAGFVVAYLRAHGTDSVLPLLETSAQEFANARAA